MKTLLLLIILCSTFPAQSQVFSSTYSPDSSALSLLFDDAQMNNKVNTFSVNLGRRWVYHLNDTVAVQIRGELMRNQAGLQNDSVRLQLFIFGKSYTRMLSTQTNVLEFRCLRQAIRAKPVITMQWKAGAGKKRVFFIDSIDMAAL